jgi:hypothetical protein
MPELTFSLDSLQRPNQKPGIRNAEETGKNLETTRNQVTV